MKVHVVKAETRTPTLPFRMEMAAFSWKNTYGNLKHDRYMPYGGVHCLLLHSPLRKAVSDRAKTTPRAAALHVLFATEFIHCCVSTILVVLNIDAGTVRYSTLLGKLGTTRLGETDSFFILLL